MMKRVFVTGSSRGIGRAIALALSKDGFHVTLHCCSNEAAAQEVAEIIRNGEGYTPSILKFDLLDREGVAKLLSAEVEKNGAYYGIVCNAGIASDAPLAGMKAEAWDRVVHTNLDGFYNVIKPLIMSMLQAKQKGRIVTLSSISGITGNRGQTNYSASKAGIIAASKSLAQEIAKREITVNCVAPGLIETDMIGELPLSEIKHAIPMQRLGSAEEVAGLVSYLFSDIAGYMTGQVLSLNGGLVCV